MKSKSFPILCANKSCTIKLTRHQIAGILAHAFFSLIPIQKSVTEPKREMRRFSFAPLFKRHNAFKCILSYFAEIVRLEQDLDFLNQEIIIQRKNLQQPPDWENSTRKLCDVIFTSKGKIEDAESCHSFVDFAAPHLGGYVLGGARLQEEILFLIKPELFITYLLCERMHINECVNIHGCLQYSSYNGHAVSFRFLKARTVNTDKQSTEIICIDALNIQSGQSQYSKPMFLRDLNKAYLGFRHDVKDGTCKRSEGSSIATGNWGCGANGLDVHLKATQQILAASEAGRSLVYHTFGDRALADRLRKDHVNLTSRNFTVGKLYSMQCKANGRR